MICLENNNKGNLTFRFFFLNNQHHNVFILLNQFAVKGETTDRFKELLWNLHWPIHFNRTGTKVWHTDIITLFYIFLVLYQELTDTPQSIGTYSLSPWSLLETQICHLNLILRRQ